VGSAGGRYRGAGHGSRRVRSASGPKDASETAAREATALRVCDIDFERRRVDVRRAFSDVGEVDRYAARLDDGPG
jgi:hypothetical protein